MDTNKRLEFGTCLLDSQKPICGIRRKIFWIWVAGGVTVILIAIGVGVGAGYALKPTNNADAGP